MRLDSLSGQNSALEFSGIYNPRYDKFIFVSNWLGVVHKLRLQDEVGRWPKNVHFLSTLIPYKMSTQEGRWSKKVKILST